MRRPLLIATGSLGALTAIMAITPPQLNQTGIINLQTQNPLPKSTINATQAINPSLADNSQSSSATKSNQPANKQKPTKQKATVGAPAAATTDPKTPSSPTVTPQTKTITGTFDGPLVDVNYGNVQVRIVVTDGIITSATALSAPTGKNQRYTDKALPTLQQQTLAIQSAAIQGVSGASYTSYGWQKSLQAALALAGL